MKLYWRLKVHTMALIEQTTLATEKFVCTIGFVYDLVIVYWFLGSTRLKTTKSRLEEIKRIQTWECLNEAGGDKAKNII